MAKNIGPVYVYGNEANEGDARAIFRFVTNVMTKGQFGQKKYLSGSIKKNVFFTHSFTCFRIMLEYKN